MSDPLPEDRRLHELGIGVKDVVIAREAGKDHDVGLSDRSSGRQEFLSHLDLIEIPGIRLGHARLLKDWAFGYRFRIARQMLDDRCAHDERQGDEFLTGPRSPPRIGGFKCGRDQEALSVCRRRRRTAARDLPARHCAGLPSVWLRCSSMSGPPPAGPGCGGAVTLRERPVPCRTSVVTIAVGRFGHWPRRYPVRLGRYSVLWYRGAAAPKTEAAAVEERVYDRSGEQGQQQRERLPPDDDDSNNPPLLRAGPRAERKRDHARHERECRHEDRPEPVAVGFRE